MTKFDNKKPYAFIDGSFNTTTKQYSWGGILLENNNLHLIQGQDKQKNMPPCAT